MHEYTITNYRKDLDTLFTKIQHSGCQYKGIYGIPQGGVLPAQALSASLNIRLITDPKRYKAEDVLIVDDLIDSGSTIAAFDNYDIAVLGKKESAPMRGSIKQTFIGRDLPDEWIHFWWEPAVESGIGSIHDNVIRITQFFNKSIRNLTINDLITMVELNEKSEM